MALQPVGQLLYPSPDAILTAASYAGNGPMRSGSYVEYAWIFQVPKTGNIAKLGIGVGAVNTAAALKLSLYTVDSAGKPTTTLYGGSASGTTPSVTANTFFEVSLGTPAAAVAGDFVALAVEWDSTVGDIVLFMAGIGMRRTIGLPYLVRNNGSNWYWSSNVPACSVAYDDGSYANVDSAASVSSTNLFVSSSGNEEGTSLAVPFRCRCAGIWAMSANVSSSSQLALYNGTTAMATGAWPGTNPVTGFTLQRFLFSSPVTLAAGTTYTIGYRGVGNLLEIPMLSAAAAVGSGMPAGFGAVNRVAGSGSAWSAVDPMTIPLLGLVIDQIDDGAGGSSGVQRVGFSGGFGG